MTRTLSVTAGVIVAVLVTAALVFSYGFARADSTTTDFEAFSLGTVHAQDGWTSLGSVGSGCAVYDHAVATNSYGFATFGAQVLRISNSVTSGCFGDQTFSKSLVDEAGETASTNGGMSGGVRQPHFEAQFDFASTQSTQQPGLFVSISPDRGDGSRMSYLGFSDEVGGIDVIFYDTPGVTNPATFSPTTVATGLSRATAHTAKFVIDYVDGPSNDVVKIYIDGILVHTGTTWENYYRFDSEAAAEQTPRTTDDLIFRTGGTAAPGTAGNGFLFDNVSLFSGTIPASDVTVTIVKNIDGVHATSANAATSSFPMNATWNATNIGAGSGSFALSPVGFNNPNPYEATTADMTSGADYSTSEDMSGLVVGAACSDGKPFALVGYTTGDTLAAAQAGTLSTTTPSFTNITTNKFVIVWNEDCTPLPPPPPPPPPANACATPLVAPAGYTLLNGTRGNDTVTLVPLTMFVGKGGNDKVTGPDGNYIVCLGNGNGAITLGNGDDTIKTGKGNAKITLGNGSAYITTGNGNATIITGDGDKTVTTGSGNDKITTGSGADTINAGNGNNTVNAGAGDDSITTGPANDTIDGGADTDTCVAGVGHNTISNCEL